jgi:glycosyltransferase involved in cell wall biosynthesis
MFKIGIDVQSITPYATGIGYYTKNLINEYLRIKGMEFFYYRDSQRTELNTLQRLWWENMTLSALAGKDKVDILHIPGFAGPCFKSKCKKITTIHDVIGVIYPRNLAPVSRFYWQKWLPACAKNSDFIITDSENTKNDIVKLLGISATKIKVIYLAADSRFKPLEKSDTQRALLKKYGIENNKYVLNVGTVEPRKNIRSLIEAFGQYLKESSKKDIVLVIAGKKGWDYPRCLKKVTDLNLTHKVIFCDYVSDDDLAILYNFAEAFVYPSFYEGFGLPVLEAISCGTPVICSKVSSLPEIGEEAAMYIDPNRVESIKNALANVLGDALLRKELFLKSAKQSKKFSWAKTAAETIETYKEVLS